MSLDRYDVEIVSVTGAPPNNHKAVIRRPEEPGLGAPGRPTYPVLGSVVVGQRAICFMDSTGGVIVAPGTAGAANIKQVEIDFGTAPMHEGSFLIADAEVVAASQITGSVAHEAPTGKDLDEVEMDALNLSFGPGVGVMTIYARSIEGRVVGAFKVNYLIG
jgi:hypothetical protein